MLFSNKIFTGITYSLMYILSYDDFKQRKKNQFMGIPG